MSFPVLLDTDIGTDVDDAIALAVVLAAPELDLRAVTTVSGDTVQRGRIARKLLALAGRDDVPVAAGVRDPVLRQRSFLWLGHEGRGIVDDGEALPLAPEHGVDLLIDMVVRERPHVVAIGPLSNVAVAIMKEPAVIATIPHLTLMGGVLGSYAGLPPVEYNLGSDPEAALVVLTAGIPTTIVPLDVTVQVAFTAVELTRLRRSPAPLVQTLCDAIEIWAPIRPLFTSSPGFNADAVALLHDPLTVAILLDRSFVTTKRLRLRPTIVDGILRLQETVDAPACEVVVGVDAPRAVEFMVDRMLSLA